MFSGRFQAIRYSSVWVAGDFRLFGIHQEGSAVLSLVQLTLQWLLGLECTERGDRRSQQAVSS